MMQERVFVVRNMQTDRYSLEREGRPDTVMYHLTLDELIPLTAELLENGARIIWTAEA